MKNTCCTPVVVGIRKINQQCMSWRCVYAVCCHERTHVRISASKAAEAASELVRLSKNKSFQQTTAACIFHCITKWANPIIWSNKTTKAHMRTYIHVYLNIRVERERRVASETLKIIWLRLPCHCMAYLSFNWFCSQFRFSNCNLCTYVENTKPCTAQHAVDMKAACNGELTCTYVSVSLWVLIAAFNCYNVTRLNTSDTHTKNFPRK